MIKIRIIKRELTINKAKKSRRDQYKMYKLFSKLITTLANKTDLRIIVRPHPTDPITNYDCLKKDKNVSVIKKGSISEWIHNAKIVVHSGCTGGLESSLRGYPTVSFLPFKSSHGHPFADIYSRKSYNLQECLKIIDKLEKKKLKKKKNRL